MKPKAAKTIAKKTGKKAGDIQRYWSQAKKQKAAGGKKPSDKYAYTMAITQRRAQRTGSHPHKKATRESFETRLGLALGTLTESDQTEE